MNFRQNSDPKNLNGAKTVGSRSLLLTPKFRWHWFLESGIGSVMRGMRGILLQSRRMDSIIWPSEKDHAFLGSVRLSEIAGRLQRTFVWHKKFWKQVPTGLRGRQKWASADHFGTVEVHGARCVKSFDNGQFVRKRQKMKARWRNIWFDESQFQLEYVTYCEHLLQKASSHGNWMSQKSFANRIENRPFWSHLPDVSADRMSRQLRCVECYISQFCLQRSFTKPHHMLIEWLKSLLQTELKIGHFGAVYPMCQQMGWVVSWGVSDCNIAQFC